MEVKIFAVNNNNYRDYDHIQYEINKFLSYKYLKVIKILQNVVGTYSQSCLIITIFYEYVDKEEEKK